MPVGRALTVLLNAQQRVVCGLGRVEEPWNVRLQYVLSLHSFHIPALVAMCCSTFMLSVRCASPCCDVPLGQANVR